MKKYIFVCGILFFKAALGMDNQGVKLKYDTVKLTNQSSIPLELSWMEQTKSNLETLIRKIKPGETITVKIGQVGKYDRYHPAKVTYKPIRGDEKFEQEFVLDLPDSKAFAFTAVKLADIMNNIWVPGVFQADETGTFNSFKYVTSNVNEYTWGRVLGQVGGIKTIK